MGARAPARRSHRFPTVARFDDAVDEYFEAHLRGRPWLDAVMYGASAAGDHSMIWLAMAGLKGWRAGRAYVPLARAVVAFGAESVTVNGLVKLAFRRQRPDSSEPRPLPLRIPRTSSFPSGHASAAFFAAALLRDDRSWPLYYGLATVVASSRAYVRVHHASDVIAGAVLGAVLGEVTRRVFPLIPPPPPERPTP